jgi:hypothetical protein
MLPSDLCYFYPCCFIFNRIPTFLLLLPPIDPRVRTLHTGLQRGRHDVVIAINMTGALPTICISSDNKLLGKRRPGVKSDRSDCRSMQGGHMGGKYTRRAQNR